MRVIERIVQIGYLFDMRRTFVFGIVRLCSCALQFTAVVAAVLMAAQVVRICLEFIVSAAISSMVSESVSVP